MILGNLRARLEEIERAGERALPRAAARIEAKLREDSTTKRGNVPAFDELGDASTARAEGDAVIVTAAGWVHSKARDLGQPEEWRGILAEEVKRALDEGR